jgi:hypothetical protein
MPSKTTQAVRKTTKTKAQIEQEFEAFKQQVINATWQHPSGCDSGKREFLRELGLENDPAPGVYEISIQVTIPDNDTGFAIDCDLTTPEEVANYLHDTEQDDPGYWPSLRRDYGMDREVLSVKKVGENGN